MVAITPHTTVRLRRTLHPFGRRPAATVRALVLLDDIVCVELTRPLKGLRVWAVEALEPLPAKRRTE